MNILRLDRGFVSHHHRPAQFDVGAVGSSVERQIGNPVGRHRGRQAEAGRSTAGKTSFETLGGNIQLLTGDERQFTYYNLALGYNFLPGEVFLGRNLAMTSGFYLLGGIGSVDFAGDQKFTVSFGAGYRVLPTDWLAIHIRMQDRIFDSDLLGESKLTNNLEANIGLTVFF